MRKPRPNGGADALPVSDPRFDEYVKRLIALLESGEAIDSDKRAAGAALKRMEDALAAGNVNFKYVEGVKRTARILQLSLD